MKLILYFIYFAVKVRNFCIYFHTNIYEINKRLIYFSSIFYLETLLLFQAAFYFNLIVYRFYEPKIYIYFYNCISKRLHHLELQRQVTPTLPIHIHQNSFLAVKFEFYR